MGTYLLTGSAPSGHPLRLHPLAAPTHCSTRQPGHWAASTPGASVRRPAHRLPCAPSCPDRAALIHPAHQLVRAHVQGSVNPSFHTGTRSSYGGQATRMPAKSSDELDDWALERNRPIMAIACVASPLLSIHSIQPNSVSQNLTSSP